MNHLSLEQCDKLQELGFNGSTTISLIADGECKGEVHTDQHEYLGTVTVVACPNLEELLEWLGDTFCELTWTDIGIGNVWEANSYPLDGSSGRVVSGTGQSPIEAVYGLCLAVKQPDKEENGNQR